MKTIIEGIYAKLFNATSSSMSELIRLLFQEGLVTRDLLTDVDFDKMIESFFATLDFDETVKDLKNDYNKFIGALDRVGGPARKAGNKISSDLEDAVQHKLGIDFKTL